jgi:CRISPR-associated protein Cmr5
MVKIKDLKRQKAQFAFNKIAIIKEKIDNKDVNFTEKEFKSHIRNIPMYIYNNGLIATIAFAMKKSKGSEEDNNNSKNNKNSYSVICDVFLEYLREYVKDIDSEELYEIVEELIESESKNYRRITLDILSMLEWLVRFSDAILDDEGDKNAEK